MGPKGELEEVKSDESSRKKEKCQVMHDWRGAARAGRHNEVSRGYDQWYWQYATRSGSEDWVCI